MDLSKLTINFKLFDVPITVLPTFWILAILFSPFLSGNEGPWIFGALGWCAAFFASVLMHELGHAFVAKRFCATQPKISLGIGRTPDGTAVFGGVTVWKPNYVAPTNRQRATVAVTGPLLELGGAAALLIVALLFGCSVKLHFALGIVPILFPVEWLMGIQSTAPLAQFFSYFVYGFVTMGVFWAFINLVPIYPMDGGHVAASLLSDKYGYNGLRMACRLSIATAILLGLAFLLSQSALSAFFFFYLAYQNYKMLQAYNNRL